MSIRIGNQLEVPGFDGHWSTWSQSDAAPGAWFVVPADDAARSTGRSYLTVRIQQPRTGERVVTVI